MTVRRALPARREKGRTRQDLIVEAAVQVIAERGLANVRISDVAERAGMTPGHVTYYFPSKNALLLSAIRRSEEQFTDRLERQLARIVDPWRRLRRYLELATPSGPRDPAWLLWFEVWAQAALDPEVAAVHEELDARSRTVLAGVIRHGTERGAFGTADPDRAALLLSATVDGLSVQLALGAGGMTRAGLLRLCLAAAEAQLGSPAAS
jgi:AcrR family transcriptional regulator